MNLKSNKHMLQGHKARKRFGQNFLIDTDIINSIAASVEPQAQDHIIEIGPGLGAITAELVASGATLHLIELDRDLVARLENQYAKPITAGQVTLINADILKVDLETLLQAQQAKLVGNLPYNISTPVLFHILNFRAKFELMTFMLQKEVVDRMSATPKTSAFSALSVILQLECDIEKLFDVPSCAFQPQPKVESAVVQLKPKQNIAILESELPAFRSFVHSCFQQRRKTLRNNLKDILDITAIEATGLNPQDRPEHLSLENYIALYQVFRECKLTQ